MTRRSRPTPDEKGPTGDYRDDYELYRPDRHMSDEASHPTPDERCPHGIRWPHECRECADAPIPLSSNERDPLIAALYLLKGQAQSPIHCETAGRAIHEIERLTRERDQQYALIQRLTKDRDLWKERHDRERAAHAKNLTEQQKVEAERDRLRAALEPFVSLL